MVSTHLLFLQYMLQEGALYLPWSRARDIWGTLIASPEACEWDREVTLWLKTFCRFTYFCGLWKVVISWIFGFRVLPKSVYLPVEKNGYLLNSKICGFMNTHRIRVYWCTLKIRNPQYLKKKFILFSRLFF